MKLGEPEIDAAAAPRPVHRWSGAPRLFRRSHRRATDPGSPVPPDLVAVRAAQSSLRAHHGRGHSGLALCVRAGPRAICRAARRPCRRRRPQSRHRGGLGGRRGGQGVVDPQSRAVRRERALPRDRQDHEHARPGPLSDRRPPGGRADRGPRLTAHPEHAVAVAGGVRGRGRFRAGAADRGDRSGRAHPRAVRAARRARITRGASTDRCAVSIAISGRGSWPRPPCTSRDGCSEGWRPS